MLKPLKRKFVLIVSILVGLVLGGVLGMSLWSSYSSQQHFIYDALERNLDGNLTDLPVMGRPQSSDNLSTNLVVMALEISPAGIVVATNSPSATLDASTLNTVISSALRVGDGGGKLSDSGIVWKSKLLANGNIRIALADITGPYRAWELQAARTVILVLLAFAVIVMASFFLADWTLKPVATAFEQQRRFIGDASHELKTPLTVILANSEILLKSKDLTEEDLRWVKSTTDEAKHMKELVGELLELAKADEGTLNKGSFAFRKVDIDLSDMLESAALEFDAIAFERECTIDTHIQSGIHLDGDSEWIARLLKILIDNACKYAQGGSTVTVSLYMEKAKQACLSVNNMGEPILAKDLPHIFDRFYRTDEARTRSDKAGGFGLGLAIAKGIVEAHGGTISATSTQAQGTTFTALLPARQQAD